MSFLKQLGQVINAGSGLIPVFGPIISMLIPKSAGTVQNVSDELPQIAAAIAQVEAVGQAAQLPGAQKLEMATPLVKLILMGSPLFKGKKIQDPALFNKGVMAISSGMADLLNAIDPSHVAEGTLPMPQA